MKFLRVLFDTRNWYSHYLDDQKRPNELTEGNEILIYVYIISHVIRAFTTDHIEVAFNVDRQVEYYYVLYDWVNNEILKK